MAGKNVIAVVGATGAQGGALARAILADRSSNFAVRAITRDPNKGCRKRPGRRRRGSRPRRYRRCRRACRRRLRARTARTASPTSGSTSRPRRRRPRRGTWRDAAKAAGVQHVIWSTLEDTRKLMRARRHADADAAGASTACRTSTRRREADASSPSRLPVDATSSRRSTGTTSICVRPGPEEGRRRRATAGRCRWATSGWPASPPRTSARSPTASSRRAPKYIGKTVGIAGENLTVDEMSEKLAKGARHAP